MKEILDIIKREFRKILSDRNLLMIFLVAPIAYPLLYGAIYINKAEENVPIIVQDYDNSPLSRSLAREIDAHQNIAVINEYINSQDIPQALASEEIHAALIIPNGFSESLKYGRQEAVSLVINPGRLLVLSDIGLPISQIVSTFGGKVTASALMKKGVPVLQDAGYAQPIKINFQYLFNPYLTYGDLILPGLLIIILSQIVLIGVSASQAKEWLLDKWRDQFMVSTSPIKLYIGKLITYSALFIVFALVSFTVTANIYGINYAGSLLDIMIIAAFGIASSTALGLIIGTFFKHRITVFVVLGFTTYPFFMISGFAWPQQQLPEMLIYLSNVLPLVPFLQAVMSVTQMQNEMSYAYNPLIIMGFQVVVFGVLFYFRVKNLIIRKEPKGDLNKLISRLN